MERPNDLWRGGPWEQPAPSPADLPRVSVPSSPRPPVLRTRRRRNRWPWFAGVLALVAVLCLSTALLNLFLTLHPPGGATPGGAPSDAQEMAQSTTPPSIPQVEGDPGAEITLLPPGTAPLSYTQIYERTAPSFVSISAASASGYNTGSGLILSQDGYLITNAHVVAGAQEVLVQLSDSRVFSAGLVGFDADEDLAVLKIEADGLTPAQFGNSDDLRCGDPVAALGDSLGYRATFTDGIVSALDREVELDDGTTMTLIQTSAAINFGNSGGPLLNQYGQVVGITTIKIISDDGSAESMGFAIPSTRVRYVVQQLLAGEEVRNSVFGFTVNLVLVDGSGLELISVSPESDAWAKGLRPGDIITAVNGQAVTGIRELTRARQGNGPGTLVAITYLRDGATYVAEVALVDAEQIP